MNRSSYAIIALLVLGLLSGCGSQSTQEQSATQDSLRMSVKMANSEMNRFSYDAYLQWGYMHGMINKAMLDMWEYTGDTAYLNYALSYADTIIQEDGTITGYEMAEYNIDNLNAGKILFTVYGKTGNNKYKKAIETLRDQMRTHPTTSEGGFWHKKKYTHQLWLDGLYMGAPFLAQYAKVFEEDSLFDVVTKQITLVDKHLYDSATSLYYHGWDESKGQFWADPKTGTSKSFWGRSVGWYAMAIVDVLDYLPKDHPQREDMISIFNKVATGIKRHQDTATGVWYQVLDQGGREGNYLEASASAMFIYALYKGINEGYLPKEEYLKVADKGYQGMLDELVSGQEGTMVISQCCRVAGLGGDSTRDGSFEYYVNETISENDLKATAPFIWASIAREKATK